MTHGDAVVAKMAALFEPAPEQWGLRGDPYLWQALRDHLAATDVPKSSDAVVTLLHRAFNELAGVDLASASDESIYLEQYAHGGMSSGHICLPVWRHQLMPLLTKRARELPGVRH
ncbi:hypothetical protein ACF06D_03585 [Streptomyces griseoluteus]|uniref:hypothetical protein n=1 Tax=Streptomyces griseoluteus TaxID=29306 RepID=UPI0036FB025A